MQSYVDALFQTVYMDNFLKCIGACKVLQISILQKEKFIFTSLWVYMRCARDVSVVNKREFQRHLQMKSSIFATKELL